MLTIDPAAIVAAVVFHHEHHKCAGASSVTASYISTAIIKPTNTHIF